MSTNANPKTTLTIGLIGYVNHGKTTLTQAIAKHFGLDYSYQKIDDSVEHKLGIKGATLSSYYFEVKDSEKVVLGDRALVFVDFASYNDYFIALLSGKVNLDVAILVVTADDGLMDQSIAQVQLLRGTSTQKVIGYINKCDEGVDQEMMDVIEAELEDLCEKNGYAGKQFALVRGSAKDALDNQGSEYGAKSIVALLDNIKDVKTPADPPFFMRTERLTSQNEGKQVFADGAVLSGTVSSGEKLQFLSIHDPKYSGHEITVKSLLENNKPMDRISSPTDGLISIESRDFHAINKDEYYKEKGSVLTTDKELGYHAKFYAGLYFLNKEEGGKSKPLEGTYKASNIYCEPRRMRIGLSLVTLHFEGTVDPGEALICGVELLGKYPLRKGETFWLEEGGKTIALGLITYFVG